MDSTNAHRPTPRYGWRALLCLPLGALLCACSTSTGDSAPSYDQMANAHYRGLEDTGVTLSDGLWEGQPYVEGGAARPRVGLARDFIVHGDLDGSEPKESVVVVWRSSGGSGTFNYVAVGRLDAGGKLHTLTAPLGDRVKHRSAVIQDGRLDMEVLQHDADDPACCPTEIATRRWKIEQNELIEIRP